MRMNEAGRRRQLRLPAAVDRETGRPMTLERALAEPDRIATPGEVTDQERLSLVRARWEAGAWSDLLICGEAIDLKRAVRELQAHTRIGTDLRRTAERAMEMVLEDMRDGGPRAAEDAPPVPVEAPPAGAGTALPVPVHRLLLIDANVAADPATQIMYAQRNALLYPEVAKSKFAAKKRDLIGAQDTRANVSASLKEFGTGYVSAAGHGRPTYLTGWYVAGNDGPLQEILTTGSLDVNEVGGKVFHIFGCHTGYTGGIGLGRNLVSAGAIAFFGYSEAVKLHKGDNDARIFCECDIEIDLALLAGQTCDEAYQRGRAKYTANIDKYFSDGWVDKAVALRDNRDCLVAPATAAAYGRGDAHLVVAEDAR